MTRTRHAALLLVVFPVALAAADAFQWQRYEQKPDAWYQSDAGQTAIANVLSHQHPRGDWPRNVDTAAKRYQRDPNRIKGTFDNQATTGEVRFLARAYRATDDARCRAAVERAIDHILTAQYENGGWPQHYPLAEDYHRHITFNDHAMTRLLALLRDVGWDDAFEFVDIARREAARRSFERGIACVLKLQVEIDGAPTIWAAQYDAITLAPAAARPFEPASLATNESAALVELLMDIDDPPPAVVRAVEAAAKWFENHAVSGIRVDRVDDDVIVRSDPQAGPIWARFYDLKTQRPIFAGRDAVVRDALKHIEQERRTGYAWYGHWPATPLANLPAWRAKYDPPR